MLQPRGPLGLVALTARPAYLLASELAALVALDRPTLKPLRNPGPRLAAFGVLEMTNVFCPIAVCRQNISDIRFDDDLKAEGSAQRTMEFFVDMFLLAYDYDWKNNPAELDTKLTRFVEGLRGSDLLDLLPHIVAALIKRGDALPDPLKDFAISFLRDPGKWQSRAPGRKPPICKINLWFIVHRRFPPPCQSKTL